MTIEEFKKKYGTHTVAVMLDALMAKADLTPSSKALMEELKSDITNLLTNK